MGMLIVDKEKGGLRVRVDLMSCPWAIRSRIRVFISLDHCEAPKDLGNTYFLAAGPLLLSFKNSDAAMSKTVGSAEVDRVLGLRVYFELWV
jgi:hypothetical protein